MTDKELQRCLRELIRELEKDTKEIQNRINEYDPYNCSTQYLAGLIGGYYEVIKKIKAKFGMRI